MIKRDTLEAIVLMMVFCIGAFCGYVLSKKATLQECARTGEAALVWGATIKCEFVKK